jgi:hypothetical protein
MYPSVVKVVPNEDFTLAVWFDNGEEGILDMKPYLGVGVFQRLKDYEHFKRVRVAFDTIEWDESVDLDPEFVHAKSRITQAARPAVNDPGYTSSRAT